MTYNGRGFDWPLLEARYRMAGGPPRPAGHLDLLPFVRRVFRHRLEDARLRIRRDAACSGSGAIGDVDGWEIPAATSTSCAAARPSRSPTSSATTSQDVRSLAVGVLETGTRPIARRTARATLPASPGRPRGDLGSGSPGLPVRRGRRPGDSPVGRALDAARRHGSAPAGRRDDDRGGRHESRDFGGVGRSSAVRDYRSRRLRDALAERADRRRAGAPARRSALGRGGDAWTALRGRAIALVAAIELAKLREHRLGDPVGALAAASSGPTRAGRRREARAARCRGWRRTCGRIAGAGWSPGSPGAGRVPRRSRLDRDLGEHRASVRIRQAEPVVA